MDKIQKIIKKNYTFGTSSWDSVERLISPNNDYF